MKTTENYRVKYHAQIQTIDGITFEFQPEHLFCEDCWHNVEDGLAHASYFGSCKAVQLDDNYQIAHAITVTKIEKGTK